MFCHSLLSDWNHGSAHFLRGIASELSLRGHDVDAYEPRDAWSVRSLLAEAGPGALERSSRAYPMLRSRRYAPGSLDLEKALDGADLVLVHEWNAPGLVQRIGQHRIRRGRYVLLFHDTHHRSVTDPASLEAFDLAGYDGVLAFGEVVRQVYDARGWARRAFTWHEAADVRVFRPIPGMSSEGDLVWIGAWGDDDRAAELGTFLMDPVRELRLRARVYGPRYPVSALRALAEAGVAFGGWLSSSEIPAVFAVFRATIHLPRRSYARALPGIPTIRPFEALACGIPLVCAPWDDVEGLFTPGEDFLFAHSGAEMRHHLRAILSDAGLARALSRRGRRTILSRHTCAHRVDELLQIAARLRGRETALMKPL